MSNAARDEPISPWRHLCAIALLPFMNTVVIPAALLATFSPARPESWDTATAAAAIAGAALIVAGAGLVAHCTRLFVNFGCGTLAPWDPTRELVDIGTYRYCRNPMKAGLFLVLLGEVLATQSPALLVWLAAFATANVFYIRLHEEPGLAKRFGSRYLDYCARVSRWWPALPDMRRSEVQ